MSARLSANSSLFVSREQLMRNCGGLIVSGAGLPLAVAAGVDVGRRLAQSAVLQLMHMLSCHACVSGCSWPVGTSSVIL